MILEAKEIRDLKQQKKMRIAAANTKQTIETMVRAVLFWKREPFPTVPPIG